MSCYAIIDTNVLVSALLSSSVDAATVQVVTRMVAGEIIPVYSSTIMSEYRDVSEPCHFIKQRNCSYSRVEDRVRSHADRNHDEIRLQATQTGRTHPCAYCSSDTASPTTRGTA